MGRKVETGVIISADPAKLKKGIAVAGKSLKTLKSAMGKAGSEVKEFGSSYQSSIDIIFKSIEVFKSVNAAISSSVTAVVKASTDFRMKGDQQVKTLKQMNRSFLVLKASIGDVLIPILAGISKTLKPVIDGLAGWIRKNRELVGSKIIEWSQKLAMVLVGAVAKGFLQATKIGNGFKYMLELTEVAIAKFVLKWEQTRLLIAKGQMQLSRLPGMEKILGKTELWKTLIKDIESTLPGLESALDRVSAKFVRDTLKSEKEFAELERRIEEVSKVLEAEFGEAAKNAMAELRKGLKISNKTLDERQKIADKAKAARMAAAKARLAEIAKEQAAEEKRLAEQRQMAREFANVVGAGLSRTLKDIASGARSAGEALRDFAIDMAIAISKLLVMKAIESASASGGPGMAMMGMIGSQIAGAAIETGGTKFKGAVHTESRRDTRTVGAGGGFHAGGFIKGYASGGRIDNVLARVTPGEYILPKPLVDNIRRGQAPTTAAYANGGMVGATSVGSAPTVNVQMSTFAVPSRAEFRRWYKSTVTPNVRLMAQRGQV